MRADDDAGVERRVAAPNGNEAASTSASAAPATAAAESVMAMSVMAIASARAATAASMSATHAATSLRTAALAATGAALAAAAASDAIIEATAAATAAASIRAAALATARGGGGGSAAETAAASIRAAALATARGGGGGGGVRWSAAGAGVGGGGDGAAGMRRHTASVGRQRIPMTALPRDRHGLRDMTTVTWAEVEQLIRGRRNSVVLMPLIYAALDLPHPGHALITRLMGQARWDEIVAAARTVVPRVDDPLRPFPWSATMLGYVEPDVQEAIFRPMETHPAYYHLMTFCASLPTDV